MFISYATESVEQYFLPEAIADMSKKSKENVAIFIASNANPKHRNDYVGELMKHMKVHSTGGYDGV